MRLANNECTVNNERTATRERITKETDIKINLSMDGSGEFVGTTGIGFFDHLLQLFIFYGDFNLEIQASGDLATGTHHLVEDIGILLGSTFNEALKDKRGIERYGFSYVPMDETLARTVVDLSGRPYCIFNCDFKRSEIGGLALEDVREFFIAFSNAIKANCHLEILYGENDHHKAEALFKSFGKSLGKACQIDLDRTPTDRTPTGCIPTDRITSNRIPSTKGVL